MKELLLKALTAMANVPTSGVIKAAVFTGIAGFTAWVLIKRTVRAIKGFNDDDDNYQQRSPVDEILGKANYVCDADLFEDLDPESKKILKKLVRQNRKYKQPEPSVKDRVREVSLFSKDPEYTLQDVDYLLQRGSKKSKKGKKSSAKHIEPKPKKKQRAGDVIRGIADDWTAAGMGGKDLRDKADKVAKELGLELDEGDLSSIIPSLF